jgi:hypothetical protein
MVEWLIQTNNGKSKGLPAMEKKAANPLFSELGIAK